MEKMLLLKLKEKADRLGKKTLGRTFSKHLIDLR